MKVTYIKIKDTELEIPEHNDAVDIFVKNFNKEFCINNGLFISLDSDGKNTEIIVFGDDKITKEFTQIFIDFNSVIEIVNITKDVKFGICKLPVFIKSFKSDKSEYNSISQLEQYIYEYTTMDDVLDKISLLGIESITESEKYLLK